MAVSAKIYTNAFFSAFDKLIDLEADTMKVSLQTASYTPSQSAHDFYDDASATDVGASGTYSADGVTLTTSNSTVASLVWNWDADDISVTGVTFNTRYAIYYDSSPASNATRPLVSYLDFGATQTLSAVSFAITHDVAGIIKATVS